MHKPSSSRFGLRAKIAPGIELHEVSIKLQQYGAPIVELRGSVATGRLKVDRASGAVITTMHLGDAGVAFIEELKRAFAANVEQKEVE